MNFVVSKFCKAVALLERNAERDRQGQTDRQIDKQRQRDPIGPRIIWSISETTAL